MKSKIIISVATLAILAGDKGFSQTDFSGATTDSFTVDGYLITFHYYPQIDTGSWGGQYKIYRNDTLMVSSMIWPFLGIDGCCFYPPPSRFSDMNGDGIEDVLFVYASGGNNGADDVYIYSLDRPENEIGRFTGMDKGEFFPEDIDGDSLPEMIFPDIQYICWHYGCAGSPRPYLVWKWDGTKYRLANFKLARHILKELYRVNPDSIGNEAYLSKLATLGASRQSPCWDKKIEDGFPVPLFDLMLTYTYCGYELVADEIYRLCCPATILGNAELFEEIKQEMQSSPYWGELQQSNW